MSEELLDQIFLFGLGETAAAPTAVVSFLLCRLPDHASIASGVDAEDPSAALFSNSICRSISSACA